MNDEAKKNYIALKNEILRCKKCSLCNNKENIPAISRSGKNFDIGSNLMIIGEASGKTEAEEGKPFVGRSGKLLDEMLKVLSKDENYIITNIVKNRPTNEDKDRVPTDEEIKSCFPYLERQIEIVKPKIILCLGNTAFKTITNLNDTITDSIGKIYNYKGIKVITFYHPSYILRNYKLNWQDDLEKINKIINENDTELHGDQLYKAQGITRALLQKEMQNEVVESNIFSDFPILGLRSDYSFLDFGGKFSSEILYLKKNGAKVINFCDDDSTGNFLKLTDASNTTKMKIIYGVSIKKIKGVSLLVKSEIGFKNLNKIVSFFNTEIKTTEEEFLQNLKQNNEDVILIIDSDFDINLLPLYQKIKNIFMESYIGLIPDDSPKNLANFNILLNEMQNSKSIIFFRNYFITKNDYNVYLVVKAIKQHKKIDEVYQDNQGRYLKSSEEVKKICELFSEKLYFEMVQNTNELATKINYKIPKRHNLLPNFDYNFNFEVSNEEVENIKKMFPHLSFTEKEAIKNAKFFKLIKQKDLTENYKNYAKEFNVSIQKAKEIYDKEIEKELEIMFRLKFVDYMMLVRLLYDFVNEKEIAVGPGRGSVGGSLVAYCINILKIEPLVNGLIFERFLNDYKSVPDIDMDFPSKHRNEIINFLKEKFGKDRVINSSTILTYKFKSAINDVGKVMRVPVWVLKEISDKIISRSSGDAHYGSIIEDSFKFNANLRKYKNEYKEFFEVVQKIEGMKKTLGTHTSGIMIFDEPYYNYTSLFNGKKTISTAYEYPDMESYGLVKLDILALAYLDVVENITKKHNIKINYEKPDGNGLNEKEVFDLIKKGYTAGIFQLGTSAMTRIGRTYIENFTDIIATNSIVRPAGIQEGMHSKYLKFKQTGKLESYGKTADDILNNYKVFTKFGNLLLFQEQIMILFTEFAGIYMADSNIAVKAISKSQGVATFFNQFGNKFINGCVKKGINEKEAKDLFQKIFSFGSFAFNLSHSVLYAYLIYYTAWLKTKFPEEYYCEVLKIMDDDKKVVALNEISERKIQLKQPDLNLSEISDFSVKDKTIYSPLSEVKYLTIRQIEKIVNGRPWNSIEEAITKLKLPKRVSAELMELDKDKTNLEEVLKGQIKDSFFIIQNKDKIINYYEKKYNIKTELLNGSYGKEIICISLLFGKPKFTFWGSWLKDQTEPTEEQIQQNPKEYGGIKKYKWMSKYAKVSFKDLENTDGFTDIYPDKYEKYEKIILNMKPYQFYIFKIRMRKNTTRGELIEILGI